MLFPAAFARALAAALISLSSVTAAFAACAPATTPNTTGDTLNSQLEILEQLCNNLSTDAVVTAIAANKIIPPLQVKAQSVVATDVTSRTITASGNGGALTLDGGNTIAAVVNVTAVSGDSWLDMSLQESADGTNFTDIYRLPRIMATGTYLLPTQLLTGVRQWRWIVGGTSPSITLSITSVRGTGTAPIVRSFFDRTINPNTLNSTTPTWNVAGCRQLQIFAFDGTQTTAPTYQLQVSPDGTNFTNIGSTLSPGNNSMLTVNTTNFAPYARIGVITAGTGVTLNYVNLYCQNG